MVLGFGRWAVKEVAKKIAGKTVKHGKLKPGIDITQFKKPKKDVLKKFEAALNREAAKTISQAASGVNIQFRKSGMPHIPKGTKSSVLTKAKGLSKLAAPVVGYKVVAGSLHKDKKKEKK